MKRVGRFRVTMLQEIHGNVYPFSVVVMANNVNEAKNKATATFSGYTAL